MARPAEGPAQERREVVSEQEQFGEYFMQELAKLLREFRQYQWENDEPYKFDLLGFMEWLDSEKGIETI